MEDRRLTAIMFTDIVGYTALMGKDERKAHEMIRMNRKIHFSLIKQYKGTFLKEMGDGILAFKGENERAIQLLSEINDNKGFFNSWHISQFENEPFFESIREDERYVKILSEMKAKYLKEQKRVQQWLSQE